MKNIMLGAILSVVASVSSAEVISKVSPNSVDETMEKLVAAVEGAGATVFGRVDYAQGAVSVDMELAPAQLLIFGNPMLGTPAVQNDPLAGLSLPLKVLVYEAEDGSTVVAWEPPSALLEGRNTPEGAEYPGKMAGAIEMFTDAAIAD